MPVPLAVPVYSHPTPPLHVRHFICVHVIIWPWRARAFVRRDEGPEGLLSGDVKRCKNNKSGLCRPWLFLPSFHSIPRLSPISLMRDPYTRKVSQILVLCNGRKRALSKGSGNLLPGRIKTRPGGGPYGGLGAWRAALWPGARVLSDRIRFPTTGLVWNEMPTGHNGNSGSRPRVQCVNRQKAVRSRITVQAPCNRGRAAAWARAAARAWQQSDIKLPLPSLIEQQGLGTASRGHRAAALRAAP